MLRIITPALAQALVRLLGGDFSADAAVTGRRCIDQAELVADTPDVATAARYGPGTAGEVLTTSWCRTADVAAVPVQRGTGRVARRRRSSRPGCRRRSGCSWSGCWRRLPIRRAVCLASTGRRSSRPRESTRCHRSTCRRCTRSCRRRRCSASPRGTPERCPASRICKVAAPAVARYCTGDAVARGDEHAVVRGTGVCGRLASSPRPWPIRRCSAATRLAR